jgi:hypothetical protein
MGENICKPHIERDLVSGVYKELLQLNNKTNQLNGLKKSYFPKRYTNGQPVSEKMFNTIRY